MGTPTPAEPTTATVVADVHQVLDDATTKATQVLSEVEHLDFGHVATEAKQALHDAVQVVKDKIAGLFGHSTPSA